MDIEPALGVVPLEGRGALPFALVHGESLVAAASWALGAAGCRLLDASVPYDALRDSGLALAVHDPLCPLTPVDFLESAVELCEQTSSVVVGVRPVTDTVKESSGGLVGGTHDRESLMSVASPVVLPPAVVATLEEVDLADLPAWVASLSSRFPVSFLEAPPTARRIVDEDDLRVLEALSRSRGPAPG